MDTDLSKLPDLLNRLYAVVDELQAIAPGRRFTPDGHLVGSIGEAVAAYSYGLVLAVASRKGFDAVAPDGREVQIKLTQGVSVALSGPCAHLLVLRLDRERGFDEVYNGPGAPVWERIGHRAEVGRQRPIGLSALRAMRVSPDAVLTRQRAFPAILPKALEAAGVDFDVGAVTAVADDHV